MWDNYGKRCECICLWFDRKKFDESIVAMRCQLRKGDVGYYTPKQLSRKRGLNLLPFAKREQYRDECEYRVISENDSIDGIRFFKASLKRIYINSWLDGGDVKVWKNSIKGWLKDYGYADVRLQSNRATNSGDWKEAVGAISAQRSGSCP